jgi:hypothetical protein
MAHYHDLPAPILQGNRSSWRQSAIAWHLPAAFDVGCGGALFMTVFSSDSGIDYPFADRIASMWHETGVDDND